MALPCDIQSAFDDPTFSDVTISFSGREIKCHKLVLCLASEYFKTLCSPASRFAESAMAIVELHEDEPDAVVTMLHYLYNFPYPRSTSNGPKFHINNFIAAKKYLLSELESIALAGVLNSIESVQAEYRNTKDITGIFELFQLLSSHRDQHEDFGDMASRLAKKHLGGLFAVPEFRKMLEEDENQELLDVAVKAVKTDHDASPAGNEGEGLRQFAQCPSCGVMWAPGGLLGWRCPRCNVMINAAQHLSRWRRV